MAVLRREEALDTRLPRGGVEDHERHAEPLQVYPTDGPTGPAPITTVFTRSVLCMVFLPGAAVDAGVADAVAPARCTER